MRSARKRQCARRSTFPVMYVAGLVLSGIFLQADPLSAATISNRDDKEHKLTIIEGEAKTDQTIKPQQVVEKICMKGCVVRLNDSEDDEYQLDPEDVVSIEDGYLYHDSLDAPANGAIPAPPAPQPPAKQ